MSKKMWIALIPAYEPDKKLVAFVQQLYENNFNIVVVDDGSSPDRDGIFQQCAVYSHVITHERNEGKGKALKTGFDFIQKMYSAPATIVTLDADGQHSPKDAVKVCQIADRYPDELILGSRKLQENVPIRSKFGNTVTRFVFQAATGIKVHDTQTGLRAFSASLIPFMLSVSGDRYEYEMNMLLECSKKKIPMQEVEIETIYMDGNSSSHFDTVKDSFRIYREILKFSLSSFVSFLADFCLFTVFTVLFAGLGTAVSITAANVSARILSALLNYNLNRRLVFNSSAGVKKTGLQYFILALLILAGNTVMLGVLTDVFSVNAYIAKIITEICFFFISYSVQHLFIFNKNEDVPMVKTS